MKTATLNNQTKPKNNPETEQEMILGKTDNIETLEVDDQQNTQLTLTPQLVPYLINQLKSEEGRKLIQEFSNLLGNIKTKSSKHEIWMLGIKCFVFLVLITAVVILSWLNAFDASIGVLFGTLAGYFLGKKDDLQ